MNSPRRLRALVAAAIAAACLSASLAPAARAKTVWACHPDQARDPCDGSLSATRVTGANVLGSVERTRVNRRAPIDCFYVYPTVSDQPGLTADRSVDGPIRGITLQQASRFSEVCRVFVPVYRQITLGGLANAQSVTPAMQARAYGDVRAAWRDYLKRDNEGRGVVLIGHSQGTFMLRRLITEEIDGSVRVRRRLVSALLTGGDVTVRKGRDLGGDFRRIPACRSTTMTGCVVGYSIFGEEPPSNAVFGQVVEREQLEVLCNNPASLRGGSGTLDGYIATAPFPGTLGTAVAFATGELPRISTPWLHQVRSYRARCERTGNVHVLRATPIGGARVIPSVPTPQWGWHLSDMNLPMGNLVRLVKSQSRAYLRQ
jgi:hypothetical protein